MRGQENVVYRVEVLILRHLDSAEPARVEPALPDLGAALDPQVPARAGHETPFDPLWPGPEDSQLLPPVGPFPIAEDSLSSVRLIGERGEQMDAVWRNLRLSAQFRPEAFLSWEQPAIEPFPLLRLHSPEIYLTDDPFAAQRAMNRSPAAADAQEIEPPQLLFTYQPGNGKFSLTPIPEPRVHYVLDGTVQLRRTRFLHFDIDLAYYPPPAPLPGSAGPPLRAQLLGYPAYRIHQSRQVRTGRLEYFDAPFIGALVRISEVELQREELTP